jgi:hypothetical protein
MAPVMRYGPSLVTSIVGSREPSQSTSARCSTPSTAKLSAPEGQSRTARTISSMRPLLGVTKVPSV